MYPILQKFHMDYPEYKNTKDASKVESMYLPGKEGFRISQFMKNLDKEKMSFLRMLL